MATTFVDIPAEAVDDHIEAALGRVATALDVDRNEVAQCVNRQFQVTHQWVREGFPRLPTAQARAVRPGGSRTDESRARGRAP